MNYFFLDVDVIFRDIVKITVCNLDRKVRLDECERIDGKKAYGLWF